MKFLTITIMSLCLLINATVAYSQNEKRNLTAKRTISTIKIDGLLDEEAWKDAPIADKFVAIRPVPFLEESQDNASEVHFLYNDEGIYVGGYFHEKYK